MNQKLPKAYQDFMDKSHARKALAAGASPAEIRHVVLLAIPTVGFPAMMAALTWIGDELG